MSRNDDNSRGDDRDRGGREDRDRGGERRFEERGGREERRSFREQRDHDRPRQREGIPSLSPRRDREARRERRGERDRDDRREGRGRSRSRRRAPEKVDERAIVMKKSPSKSRSNSAPRKARRSGFDQKEMLPENFAMMQLAAMKAPPPQVQPRAGAGGFPMPPPNMVPNPEVELFLQHNPVEPHAATRLRSLPVELQTIVLQRGSLFGGRDPTAVLLGRIRSATSGLRNTTGMYGGAPPGGGYGQQPTPFSGAGPPNLPPGGTGVVGMTQPAPSESAPQTQPAPYHQSHPSSSQGTPFQAPQSTADMAKMWASMQKQAGSDDYGDHGGGSGSGSGGAASGSWGGGGGGGGSWGGGKNQDQNQGPDYSQYVPDYNDQGSWQDKSWDKNKWSRNSKNSWNSYEDGSQDAPKDQADYNNDSSSNWKNEKLTPEMMQMRGKMQSSLAELSVSMLGKNAAKQAGLVDEQGEADAGDAGDGSWTGDGSGSGVPPTKTRIAAPAPTLNPFRSKPRAAPVAADTDPQPLDPPIDFKSFQPKPEAEPAQLQQQEQQLKEQLQQHQQQQWEQQKEQEKQQPSWGNQEQQEQKQEKPPEPEEIGNFKFPEIPLPPGIGPPPPPEPSTDIVPVTDIVPTPETEPWTAEKLASLNIPPGIAVRMIRQNRAVLTSSFLQQMQALQAAQAATEEKGAESGGAGSANGSNDKSDSDHPDIKRAQAIATLSYYGLTDPTNQEDVAKAVQAVAVATGDQATAVALWHQMCGTEDPSGIAPQTLTEEQQLEVQQAAASAQYSQYWLQQQFQSQLAMFENQRLMATGDNPVTTVEDAKESALKGPRGDPAVRGARRQTNQPMLPGDWTCPGCGDHQFARNRVCRFCGASRPLGSH